MHSASLHGTLIAALSIPGLWLSSCAPLGSATEHASLPNGGENAAMAATFVFMFTNNGSMLQSKAATYCLGIETKTGLLNPSPELISALTSVEPKVSPASECRKDIRVIDAAGRPSLIFSLRTIKRSREDSWVFKGGYYEGNFSASDDQYNARWSNNVWRVNALGSRVTAYQPSKIHSVPLSSHSILARMQHFRARH